MTWALSTGGLLEDRPVYVKSRCFDPFPFPADVPESLKDRIRAEAEALDALRKRVLAEHEDLTLTGLYNVVEALRAGQTLTLKERDAHDRGLVTLIRQHHDAIDVLVAEAYGWPADLADEEILTRLVALNKERAAEEARGLVRWLRPEFQAPDAVPALPDRELDLGETKANAQVAGFLFNSAKCGNVTAQIFWLKTRARWRETPVELKHSGSVARETSRNCRTSN